MDGRLPKRKNIVKIKGMEMIKGREMVILPPSDVHNSVETTLTPGEGFDIRRTYEKEDH